MYLFSRFKSLRYITPVGIGVLSLYSYKVIVDNASVNHKSFFSRACSSVSASGNVPAVGESQNATPDLTGMTLRSVQVFFRHGARTPLRHLEPQVAEVPYLSDVLVRELPHTAIPIIVCTPCGEPRPVSSLQSRYEKVKFQGGCHAGQLTIVGQDQTYCLGRRLRYEYVDKHGLVSLFDPKDVYIRSTNIDRTIESLRCVVAGMFPDLRPLQSEPVKVTIHLPKEETLVPNPRICPCLYSMEIKASEVGPQMTSVKTVTDKINAIIGNEGELNMMNWRDHIAARKVHGLDVPDFMEELSKEIDRAAVDIFEAYTAGLLEDRPIFLRLSAGTMLHTIHENMKQTIADPSSPKVYLFSVHDSSLVPLLHGLSAFDERWPPYAADVRVELWQDDHKEHWVHLTYCGKTLTPRGVDRPLMSLADFRKLISPYAISFDTFLSECQDVHGVKGSRKPDLSAAYQEEEDNSMARKGL